MKLISLLFFLVLSLLQPAAANDTLNEILERIRITRTQHFNYQETRHMQLMTEPWQSSGELFISPTKMVIAQLIPDNVTTVITADRMQHRDPENNIDRSIRLEQPFAVPGMEPFMQLLYRPDGNSTLQQDYTITHKSDNDQWSLQLLPRQHVQLNIDRMQLSGKSGCGPDQLLLIYRDGDSTEWSLSLQSQGETAQRVLQQQLTPSQ